MSRVWLWCAAGVLLTGAAFTEGGVREPRRPALRAPLAEALPAEVDGLAARDVEMSENEVEVAGVTDYLMRIYGSPDTGEGWLSVYVGYYETQMAGRTIHSPKNCLPGGGWEPIASTTLALDSEEGSLEVNEYLLKAGDDRLLVLYWYQGRGRVEANEYRVKWDLLRDAALRGRSDEALVRIVVPVEDDVETARAAAAAAARLMVPAVEGVLPAWSPGAAGRQAARGETAGGGRRS